jgi:uncharacterized protein YoxC
LNRVSLRIGVLTTVAALSALVFSTVGAGAASAQSFGKDGTIHACYKAKGKNKGALRVVPASRACRKLRGFRPLSWGADSTAGGAGQSGSQGAAGSGGDVGQPGPEGKQGTPGAASQVEKSLIDTVDSQTKQINSLTKEVTDLTDEVLDLEGDVTTLTSGLGSVEGNVTSLTSGLTNLKDTTGETCEQVEAVTEQSDKILSSLLGSSVAILGNLLNVPTPPSPLGTFECG